MSNPTFQSQDYDDISSMTFDQLGESISNTIVESDLALPDPQDTSKEAERRRRLRKYIAAMLAIIRALGGP